MRLVEVIKFEIILRTILIIKNIINGDITEKNTESLKERFSEENNFLFE